MDGRSVEGLPPETETISDLIIFLEGASIPQYRSIIRIEINGKALDPNQVDPREVSLKGCAEVLVTTKNSMQLVRDGILQVEGMVRATHDDIRNLVLVPYLEIGERELEILAEIESSLAGLLDFLRSSMFFLQVETIGQEEEVTSEEEDWADPKRTLLNLGERLEEKLGLLARLEEAKKWPELEKVLEYDILPILEGFIERAPFLMKAFAEEGYQA